MENITNIGIGLLIFSFVYMTIFIFTRVFKSERSRKQFKPNMKPGDLVYSPIADRSINGEILEVGEDSVVIKVTVLKDRVYPKTK